MKKVFVSVLVGLALGAVSSVSAIDMSAGGGAFFASDFGGGVEAKISYQGRFIERTMKTPYSGGGINAFLDVTYAEISVGYLFAGGKWESEGKTNIPGDPGYKSSLDASFSAIQLGLLGKYPIALSDEMTVFPAAGIHYQSCISGAYKSPGGSEEIKWDGKNGRPKAADYSAVIFNFGGGLDFALAENMFIRSELLYGIRLASKAEDDMVKELKPDADDAKRRGYDVTGPNARLGHGLTIKAGVGLRL